MADEQALTDKEQLFVDLYLGKCWLNATAAAREAGYSNPNANGAEIRHRPHVAALIQESLDQHAMALPEALARLAEQARNDLAQYLRLDRRGKPSLDLKALQADGKAHLITGITPTKWGLKIEWADPQAALRDVLRHHGAFKDRVTVDLDDDALDAAIERELARMAAAEKAGVPEADRVPAGDEADRETG